jgi:hypothetical protein
VRSTKKTPDSLVGRAVVSGNLTKRFVVLKDTAHHIRPFFGRDGMLKLTWDWMLLCGEERGEDCQAIVPV